MTMINASTPLRFDYSSIPEAMKSLPRWIGFTDEKRPIDPHSGKPIPWTTPATHRSFEDAHAGYQAGHCFALGFVLVAGDGICCIDLDKVHGDRVREQRASQIVQHMPGWIERSVSGTGLHIWGLYTGEGFKTEGVEFYTEKRAMLVTAKVMPQSKATDLINLQAGGEWLVKTFKPPTKTPRVQHESSLSTLLGEPPAYLTLIKTNSINAVACTGLGAPTTDAPRVISALSALSADDYDHWWTTGLALYRSDLPGNDAYKIWLDWSATCTAKFSEQACSDKWASFATASQPDTAITLGTLFHRAKQAGWTDPERAPLAWRIPDLLPVEHPPKPYPTESLPKVMHEAVRAIAHHVAAPVALAAQCVIAAAAYVAQTRVNAPHIHYPNGMPCSLFQIALADSGDRKSACYKLAFKPLTESERLERDQYASSTAERAQRASMLKGKELHVFELANPLPANPRTMYTDSTFEKIAKDFVAGMSAASWATDEGGRILGGHSMQAETRAATLGGLVKLYDDGTVERDRAGEIGGIAYDRRFTMHLMAQTVTVRDALNDPVLQGQGFLPRFLLTSVPSLAGTRLITTESMQASAYKSPALQRYWSRLEELAAIPRSVDSTGAVKPPVIELSPAALRVWIDFYNRVEREQSSVGKYAGRLKPFASRAGENARRVAAVLSFFEDEHEISAETMNAACEVVEHSIGEWARWIGGIDAVAKSNREALNLLEWIRLKDLKSFHRDTLGAQGPARGKAKLRDQMLNTLIGAGWLRTTDGKTFEVNPCAESAESAEACNLERFDSAETVQITADKKHGAEGYSSWA